MRPPLWAPSRPLSAAEATAERTRATADRARAGRRPCRVQGARTTPAA
jgi:hypothetical protein